VLLAAQYRANQFGVVLIHLAAESFKKYLHTV
jgi:hypothetical protein